MHHVLRDEFVRCKASGIKINHQVLREFAPKFVHDPSVPCTQQEIEQDTGKCLPDALSIRWVYDFCARYNIKVRIRTRNKSLSDEKTALIHKHIAHHLGIIKREFDEGLDESTVENFDETHMVIDMDNGHVLEFHGLKHVTYADVASARDCFTVCMRISGGPEGKIEKPSVIFQNPRSNYPITGIPDNIPGITYRSSPKGWISSQLFHEYFSNE